MQYRIIAALIAVTVVCIACSHESAPSQAAPAASAPDVVPDTWNSTRDEAIRLFRERKFAESNALLEKFVAAHPNYSQGHYHLGENHELMGWMDTIGVAPPARREHLETAVRHFKRARELSRDPLDREAATRMLVLTLSKDKLNRLDEALDYARANADELPTAANYDRVANVLREMGRGQDGADALIGARDRLSAYEWHYKLADSMVNHVENAPDLAPASAEALLNQAADSAERMIAVDAAIKAEGVLTDDDLRGAGLLLKGRVMRARTERFVNGAAEKARQLTEAERLRNQGLALLQR